MRLVLVEDGSDAVAQLLDGQARVSSALVIVEFERAVRRGAPERAAAVPEVLAGLTLFGPDRSVLARAARLAPAELRSLDAIHLASALLVADDLDGFVCYDSRLAEAATALGLRVLAPRNPDAPDGA